MPERNATRSVPIVVAAVLARRPPDLLRLRLAAVEGAQRRQPAHDVEEVRRQQRQRLPALAGPPLRVAPDEPHEHRHQRQRQQHDAGRDRIDDATRPSTATGTDDREHDLRQVAANVVSSASTPATAAVATSALSAPSSAAGLVAQPPLDELEPERRRARAGGAPADDARRPTAAAARAADDEREQFERPCDLAERRAVERPCGHVGEQHRLGEDEQRRDDADDYIAREGDAHGPRPSEEAAVERGQGSGGGRLGAGVLGSSSPPTRARKT